MWDDTGPHCEIETTSLDLGPAIYKNFGQNAADCGTGRFHHARYEHCVRALNHSRCQSSKLRQSLPQVPAPWMHRVGDHRLKLRLASLDTAHTLWTCTSMRAIGTRAHDEIDVSPRERIAWVVEKREYGATVVPECSARAVRPCVLKDGS
jgi:hypothetical protein